jgi:hypothetical protein
MAERAIGDGAQATATISVASRVPVSVTLPLSFHMEAGENVSGQDVVCPDVSRCGRHRTRAWPR